MSSPSRKKTPRQPPNAHNEPFIVELVEQDDFGGCGVACLAMVMKKTYAEIADLWRRDFSREGMTTQMICDFLGEHGYEVVYKAVKYFFDRNFARDELLKPFAPVHIVSIRTYFDDPHGHVVVMDSVGQVFCPSGNPHEIIDKAYLIDEIVGIYPPRNR